MKKWILNLKVVRMFGWINILNFIFNVTVLSVYSLMQLMSGVLDGDLIPYMITHCILLGISIALGKYFYYKVYKNLV